MAVTEESVHEKKEWRRDGREGKKQDESGKASPKRTDAVGAADEVRLGALAVAEKEELGKSVADGFDSALIAQLGEAVFTPRSGARLAAVKR